MITHAFIIALAINGIYLATDEGMILYKPCCWISRFIPEWLGMPLYACPTCMASVWSVLYAEDTHDYQDGLLRLKQLNKEINELVEHIDE
jgi:hypothetical protein